MTQLVCESSYQLRSAGNGRSTSDLEAHGERLQRLRGAAQVLRVVARREEEERLVDLRGPLAVVDDNHKVVGALSVVGATKRS